MEKMKDMREMESTVRAVRDQPVQKVTEKKQYETPSLTKLGNVKQVTTGGPGIPAPDVGIFSGAM